MRPATPKLNAEERQRSLSELDGWTEVPDRDAITKDFKFKNFKHAFSWMTAVALEAEQADHHPEWQNIYNRVKVVLTTHDATGVTAKDITLAKAMDQYARN